MRNGTRRLRDCLGQFATGVTVVTVRHGDLVHGATVSSFTSVSLDPPLVMACLDRESRMCARLAGAAFGVSILAADQRALALHFAGQRSKPETTISWEQSDHTPRIAGCVAHLACSPWASYDGGDHIMYVGEVRHFEFHGGEPLVFHRGVFGELLGAPDEIAWIGSLDCPTEGIWAPRSSEFVRPARSA
jgi:flavin reductase (DIM6/NTAB) family NADH-FMN oxidoreductase RutF